MAFPTTGILDNFNRADEAPVSDGGKWSFPAFSGDRQMNLVSNALTTTSSWCSEWRNNANYGPDVEVFLDVPNKPAGGNAVELLARLVNGPGTAALDGYLLDVVANTGAWTLWRIDNNTQSLMASGTQAWNSGDGIGLEIIGTMIKGKRRSAGVWSDVVTTSESSYTAAGRIGLAANGMTVDNFGGGTVVVGGTPTLVNGSDSLGFSEASPLKSSYTQTDTVSTAESIISRKLSTVENITTSDILSQRSSLVSDLIPASDSSESKNAASVSEIFSIADTFSLLSRFAVTETLSESESAALISALSGIDPFGINDLSSLKTVVIASDLSGFSDGSSIVSALAGSDSLGIGDTSSVIVILIGQDALTGSDVALVLAPGQTSGADNISFTESAVVVVRLNAADSLFVLDSQSLSAAFVGQDDVDLGSEVSDASAALSAIDTVLGVDAAQIIAALTADEDLVTLFDDSMFVTGYLMKGTEIRRLSRAMVEPGEITRAASEDTVIVIGIPEKARITKAKVE